MKPLAALALGVCLTAPLAGQNAQPVFRAGVELVTVDVVVTTGDGRPVHGLKAEDFQLFEDDVPQDIRTFRFLNFSTPEPAPILPAGVVTNQVEPGGIFAVVLDEIGYQVNDIRDVRRTATRFFQETLQPNDHVVVVRSGAASQFTLTTDHALALEAIGQSTGRRERTLGITAPGSDESLAESTPTIETFGSGVNGRRSHRVLLDVVNQLKHITARRKAILWFSRGGDLPPNITESFELGRNVGRDDDGFWQMIETARAANVAVYTIDPRGLQSPAADLGRDIDPMDTGSLRDLAAFTGGRAVLNNDINGELERIAAENRAYYLLGYEPAPSAARNRPRKLRVVTRAPGVSVLHRSTFLPGSEAKAKPLDLIASPLPVRDLAILLAPAAVAVDRSRRGIIVPFEIGGDLADNTAVKYSAIALDPSGKVVSRGSGQGRAVNGRVTGEARLAVEAKTYQVRFAAQAQSPEISGLAFATVRVPPGNTREPECGGFVFEQPGARRGVRAIDPTAPVTISTMLSATDLDGTVAPIGFALGPAGGAPQKTWPVHLAIPLAKGLYRVSLSLKPPLPRGNLEIQLLRNDLLINDNCVTQFVSR